MAQLQHCDAEGNWHDMPGFLGAAFGPIETRDNGDGTYTHVIRSSTTDFGTQHDDWDVHRASLANDATFDGAL